MTPVTRILVNGTIISTVLGIAAGLVCLHFSVPFYFSFFFVFTLCGLITLFVLAAKTAGPPGG